MLASQWSEEQGGGCVRAGPPPSATREILALWPRVCLVLSRVWQLFAVLDPAPVALSNGPKSVCRG